MSAPRLRLMDESEADDPLLSLVNLIDVFLVLVAALLLVVARNPLNAVNPLADERVTVIRNPGSPEMEVIIKDGQKIQHFKGDGAQRPASGGVRAGVAWRLPDGSLVYVPE
ncbi:DUF2149 domain-containing protein [Zoogloea sp.]|uniref:DUF2149 domain-containing protein n=1 Tax=Zoogloea sp. TaxID=49181 RepID=UPI0035AFF304|nr:DUF2149 domain-containing protein [Rhodocyclales bacterium]